MNKILLLGGGGHAKVVSEIIREIKDNDIVGYISPNEDILSQSGIRYLGNDSILEQYKNSGFQAFAAIGDNQTRKSLMLHLQNLNFHLPSFISKNAIVSSGVIIGDGVVVMPGAVINTDCKIDNGAIINTNSSIDHDCQIGKYVHIAPGCSLAGGVMTNEGTLLGIGSSVIPKINIGEWALIGAGSVVVNNIPPSVKVFGVPAQIRKEAVLL